jgi:NAD(P)-dependent dehydrogenase (short-subunit alcohol dehydrogenase family)
MPQRLASKKAIITGGASGIGKATVELFVGEGAQVVFCDVDRQNGQMLADRLGERVTKYIYASVSEAGEVERMIEDATSWLGGLDILVNNAGVGGVGLPKPLADLSSRPGTAPSTPTCGTYLVSKFALPHLQTRRRLS